jgi:hypothetical protein
MDIIMTILNPNYSQLVLEIPDSCIVVYCCLSLPCLLWFFVAIPT